MLGFSRNQIILGSLLIVLLAVGAWVYTRRPQQVDLASYAPESALGYLEINDWPQLIDRFTATTAWRQLAPVYGLDNKFNYVGKLGWLAAFTGSGETAILARSQFAVVVTALEVRGEEVRPRGALIVETHSGVNDLRKVIDKRLPELARRVYGREVKETSEYGGVAVTSYASGIPGRNLYSAQIEGEWILANHSESLRACIDTRLGRAPSMTNNFYLKNARPEVERGSNVFGFITGEGVTRLLRFSAFLLSSGGLRETGIIDTLQDVLSDLSTRTSDGIVYSAGFENGIVADRYLLLFKPDLIEKLRPAVNVNQAGLKSLGYIPSKIRDVTVINVVDPNKTLDGIEAAISARIGAGQGFLLHRFLLGSREAFLGIKPTDNTQPTWGDEIAYFGLTDESENRIWLIAVKDREKIRPLVERYLSHQGATIRRENSSGFEIVNSSGAKQGSALFIDDYLALGRRAQLLHLIEARKSGLSFNTAPQFISATKPSQQPAIMSFSSVKDDSGEMMMTLARLVGAAETNQPGVSALEQLPYATSGISLNERGIYIESHAAFGNFPFFVSLIDGTTKK